ncbi:hypothetical protein [Tautonia marina]|uniref:hypothetical protein n=1 Tax=Tautonia marina TaxID=2653855 RepID=UPI001260CED8|nr:hypothetical protein [Tautonia marina]
MLLLWLLPMVLPARAGEPSPAIEIRAIRPDAQVFALLSLFEGTAWPHPAAALADWKQSAPPGEERSLGKTLEALLTALNPLMAQELATFDGTRFLLDLDSGGQPHWAAVVPKDDGTITALATALVLTDGRREASEGPFAVDRIGPNGAPLVASTEPGAPVILASDRPALRLAMERLNGNQGDDPGIDSGWIVRVDPKALAASEWVPGRQIAAAVLGLGYESIEARAALVGDCLEVVVEGPTHPLATRPGWGAIDPSWLDVVPNEQAAMAVSLAIGPGADAWAGLLQVVDRVEQADPTRGEAVAFRQRLGLLALIRGIRLELDFWPNLTGVTAWVSLNEAGFPDGGLLALHATSDQAAEQVRDRVVTRIVEGLASVRWMEDRPLKTARVGNSVLIGWGAEAFTASLVALADPEQSAGSTLRSQWTDAAEGPSRVLATWPGRLPWIDPAIREALIETPPVVVLGWTEGEALRDRLRWEGLRDPIRRFLDQLPAEPTATPLVVTEDPS